MTRPGRFFWKLFLGNAILIAIVLGSAVWLIVGEVEQSHRDNLTLRLRAQAVTLRHAVRPIFDHDHHAELQRMAAELGAIPEADMRVTMVALDGRVLADSQATAEAMESHATRPEIVAAMRDGWGQAERHSGTLDRDLKYVAVRVDDDQGRPLGTVRLAMPLRGITRQTSTMSRLIWQTAAIALAAAVVFALGLAYLWSNPIKRITEIARSLSRGDLSARTDVHGHDEIAEMAVSLDQMRDSISRQMHTIEHQRRNLEYLIRSLSEGVIVAGPDGRIVLMNETAGRLLGIPDASAPSSRAPREGLDVRDDRFVGRNVADCIAQPQLRELLIAGSEESEAGRTARGVRELRLQVDQPGGPVHLLARCSQIGLPGTNGHPTSIGRLVVLTDITQLTEAIRMKTDFVANASHELRTPLSAIRASVETLEQVDPAEDPEAAARFIRMIGQHSARLEELVSDLLELSRLESNTAEFHAEEIRLDELLDDVQSRFTESIELRKLRLEMNCPDNCRTIAANGRLLKLVLDNLVANAIKFTEPPGHVWVNCAKLGSSVSIEVRDDGCGIPKEDQDRVFERFYQVERARSDTSRLRPGDRGTGLGLAIVRHAVAAMHGSILLKSQPGKGTSVTVFITQPS